MPVPRQLCIYFVCVVKLIMRSAGLILSLDSEQVNETSRMERLEQLADLTAAESLFLDEEPLAA